MEIDLVQRVELKLLLANSDEKLSAALSIFLPPLLQKLASPDVEVIRKVVEVLHFIKSRKKQSRGVELPEAKLMDLYKKSVLDLSPGIVRQNRQILSFVSLELADRAVERRQNSSIPFESYVFGLRNDEVASEDVHELVAEQFSLFLLTLSQVQDPLTIKVSTWDSEDLAVVQKRLPDIFILNLRMRESAQRALRPKDVRFYVSHGSKLGIELNPASELGLNSARKAALRLAKAYPNEFKYTLVAAMGDPMLDISRQAHSEVLKLRGFDPEILHNWALNGNEALSAEVIELMNRHRLFANLDPNIIFHAFKRENLHLRQASLRLLRDAVASEAESHSELLKLWGLEVKLRMGALLHQYIIDDGWPRSQAHSSTQTHLRQLSYELLGVFSPTKSTLSFLFQSLERDSADIAPNIQKSLSWILESGDAEIEADKLMGLMLTSKSNRARYAAVKFAESRLSAELPVQKVICLLGLDPSKNRSDVISEAQRGLLVETADMLPSFSEMIEKVSSAMDLDIASKETVQATLLFLLACLIRWPTASTEWESDLTAAMSLSMSPMEPSLRQHAGELVPFLELLLSFVYTDIYHEIVPLLLRRIFLIISPADRIQIVRSNVVNVQRLVAVLGQDSNGYGVFVAEYFSQIAPQVELADHKTKLQVLAQAVRAAELSKPSNAVTEVALSTKNIEAIQVLAVSGKLTYNEDAHRAAGTSQFALACLAIHSDDASREQILMKLLEHSAKSFDDIVANGEAISVTVSGWSSKVLQDRYPYLSGKIPESGGQRSWSLEERTLASVVNGIRGSPESRRVACVRLLCLAQYSFYNIDDLLGVARGVQSCFMSLLSDADDVTQESAGRGLSILFENSSSDPKLQKSLLSGLLSSFTDETSARKHTAGMLTADTQVFEPGALPSGPRGDGNISTYKDVLSLANETGDSSLIYKFMSLSASSQIWSGRKGMAFSLEQIIAKSELAIETANGSELGHKLIPKLFRYLHDPIEVTREAMKHIWTALVPSSRRPRVIKLYLDEISQELLAGVTDREWRVRQASTSALADLVSQGYLQDHVDMWNAGFRAVDDIKESVSAAGSELLKSLTNSLVRANSTGRTSDLSNIVPFLIKGLGTESTVKYSLETLLKLSETSGFKPWAPGVLEELTLQLSSLEPQALNYLALNTSQEFVDNARNKGLRSSPIMQGIEAMVERGAPSNDEMWEILPGVVKKSVGVSSQLAGSRLIILTCMHSYGESKRASEQLLKASLPLLWSINDVVSQSYASALGYMCRQLPLSLVVSYADKLKTKFLQSDADETRARMTIALALRDFSMNASDEFGSVSSSTLPLAFVGKFASSDTESKQFREVWENNTGGALSLRLYAQEIVQFCLEILQESSVRSMKIASSKALAEVFAKIEPDSNSSVRKDALAVAKALLANLAGRSWPGKEYILDALVSSYAFIPETEQDILAQIDERVLNEIQRKNAEYKLAAIPSVAKFLRHLVQNSLPAQNGYKEQLEGQLTKELINVVDGDSDTLVAAFSSVFVAVSLQPLKVKLLEHVFALNSWKFRLAACEVAAKSSFDNEIWHIITEKCATDDQHENVRLEWSRIAVKFKDQPQVLSDVRARIRLEKSSLVLAELTSIA